MSLAADPVTREPASGPWRSIRFQISFVLLMSALNGAVLLALAILLLAVDQGESPNDPRVVGAVRALAEMAEPRVLTGGLVWVVFVSLATVTAAVRLRWTLSRPLERLARAADRVADGELTAPIPIEGNSDEFDRLGVAFESMRRHLVGSIERLDQQNAEMGVMLRSLGDGVVMVDADGRVVEYNPAAAGLFAGCAPARPEMAEQIVLSRLLPELAGDLREAAEAEGTDIVLELGAFGRRYLVAHVNAVVGVDPAGSRAYVVVLRDVTEARKAEQITRDFLSVVTHELKTPLTAVQGFAKLLLMGKGGVPTPIQADLLRRVSEQSEVLRVMIDDLLDATRLEGGNLAMNLTDASVGELVLHARNAFEGAAAAAGIVLVLDTPPSSVEGVFVHVDAGRVQQILGNLIRNAMKFTPRDGTVTLRVNAGPERVVFEVEDDGVGIPEAAIPKLFQKFYQVDRGDTRNQGGAGLGLFICSQLARAMGGHVGVTSKLGEGSRFRLSLPRAWGG